MGSTAKKWIGGLFLLLTPFWIGTAWGRPKSPVLIRSWVAKLKQNSFFNRRPFQFASPTVADNKVFVGIAREKFYAVDAKRGKKVWQFKTQGPVHAKARVLDQVVYFADLEGVAYALEAQSGKPIWMTRIGAPVMAAPLVVADKVYVSSLDKALTCLDRKQGGLLWQVNFGNRDPEFTMKGSSDPVLFGSNILIGYSDGMILAHHLEGGQIAWAKQFGDPFEEFHDVDAEIRFYPPLLISESESRAYVTSADGGLFAFRPQDGTILWRSPVGGVNDVVIADPYLYVTAKGIVYCFQRESGKILWEQDLQIPEISSPAVYQNWLVVVATKGRLFVLDRNSGDIVYRWYVRGGSYGDPVIDGNRVYLLSNASRLYAFQFRGDQ